MSTSQNRQHPVVDGYVQRGTHSSTQGRASFRSVRKLMNRIKGSHSGTDRQTKLVKQGQEVGLVKGGLTPTVSRRESPAGDDSGSNNERRKQYDRSDSTSRPLMTQSHNQVQLPKWEVTPGLLGIHNHGNTCFMNTIVQCLSNTDLFTDYFVNKRYKDALQVKGIAKKLAGNSRGEVTEHLGSLLDSLWSGEYTPELSNQFKAIVSKYNGQYKGSSQHDAQEFLLWLLDRINDELHHSQKKKMAKSKKEKQLDVSTECSPEMVLAACSGFEVYNRFQALYQSSLTCPNCGQHSNTYESYLCLSLPVPQKSLRPVYMIVVYIDENPKQLKIALELNILDTVKELRDKLAYELEVPPKRLILCQVHEDGFRNTYGDDQLLSDIHESETIYVFETYPFSEVSRSPSSYEVLQILIVHVEKVSPTKCYRFCNPQVVRIQRDIDFITLQSLIIKSMGLAVSEDKVDGSMSCDRAIFDVRVVDSGASDCYLPSDVDLPLYTEAIDRAISTYGDSFGPAHVKFVVEWDPKIKDIMVDNDEDLIEEHNSVHKVRLNQQQPSHVSLDECLKLFTKEEKLGEGDAWNCPSCHKEQQGTIKKLGLWSAPDILVIHLKRFRNAGLRRTKLNILVNFPVTDLEMGHHLLPTATSDSGSHALSDLYDLYAVSNHYGNMNGGHYTAFCKNPIDGQWYEYDDTHVKPLNHRDIVSRSAYLLFYQRKKLTNDTVDALHSSMHWVFNYQGRRRLMSESKLSRKTDLDAPDGKSDRSKTGIHTRAKSEPYVKGKSVLNDDDVIPSESLHVDINSPRREERPSALDVNSPRQMQQKARMESPDSPPEELYVNLDQVNKPRPTEPVRKSAERISVAEQILQSKPSADQQDGRTLHRTIDSRRNYKRTDSENGPNYHSGGETTSPPSSPQGSGGSKSNPPSPGTNNVNLLNNERENTGVPGNVKLKIHSNQIRKDNETKFNRRDSNRKTAEIPIGKTTNQKVANSVSNVKDTNAGSPTRTDIFSTPQQPRKSPTSPVQNGFGFWSTPQPARKQYSNIGPGQTRPPMDRQFSVPVRNRPTAYDGQRLEVEGHGLLDNQPRSLPMEDRTNINVSKPPLPKPSQNTARLNTLNGPPDMRPVSAPSEGRVPVINDRYSDRIGSGSGNQYDRTGSGTGNQYNDRTGSGTGNQYNDRTGSGTGNQYSDRTGSGSGNQTRGRSSYEDDIRRAPHGRVELRERNRSEDRMHDTRRRSTHTSSRPERPLSYHQTAYDTHDEYYLTQPINDLYSISRTQQYATMRAPRHDPRYMADDYSDEDSGYISRQRADHQYTSDLNEIHQPRSRAPYSYNPSLYQDRERPPPSSSSGRSQHHLQTAKYLSRLALQEKQYLQQRMKSQVLKESSV